MNGKRIGKKLLFPPVWLLMLLTAFSAAALSIIFLKGWENTVAAYVCYALAFYTLSALVTFCVAVLPKEYGHIRRKLMENPLGNRYMTDSVYRAKVSLGVSLGVNLLYVCMNLLFWYLYRSWWFVCLAVYYGILSVMRFLLVRYVRVKEIGADPLSELKRALTCSYIMLLLNVFLSGAVLMMVYQNRGYEYHGVLIYVMAAYTFYTATYAIVSFIRHRRLNSPVMSAAKSISLAAALVSMLNLETAMFSEFGGTMSAQDQKLMIMLTGAGISIIVIAMAVGAILGCTKQIKKMRYSEHG